MQPPAGKKSGVPSLFRAFPLALTFLTILPWPPRPVAAPEELARALFWFPWVGAVLGAIYAAAGVVAFRLFPSGAAAVVLVALTVILTRGLHLDGLADTLDGLGGGRDPASRLAVMKDSRLGAFGALALVLALLLKFAFLQVLLEAGRWGALFLFPAVSRAGMVLLAFLSPYARPEGGLGRAMTEGVTPGILSGALLSAVGLALLAGGLAGLVVLTLAGLTVLGLSRLFTRLLGGVTGDVLGAANEILEILALAVLAAR